MTSPTPTAEQIEAVARAIRPFIRMSDWESALRDLKRAMAAMPAPVDEGWQPIGSAPRDGTHVIIYAERGKDGKKRRSRRGCFANVAHYEKGWGWLTSPSDYQVKPTHWRPLPEPPAPERLCPELGREG